MKIFENKSIFKKIVIILLMILITSFCFSGKVKASDDGVGGKLLNPIVDMFVFLGDGVMNIIHGAIFSSANSTIHIDMTSTFWEVVGTVAVFIVAAVVVAAVTIFSAGVITAAVAAATAGGVTLSAIGVGTVLVISLTGGVAGAAVFNSNVLPDDIYLPVYQISPEKIFSNEVLLFDVDFFNPSEDKNATDEYGNVLYGDDGQPIVLESTAKQLRTVVSNWYILLRDIAIVALLSVLVYIGIRIIISSTASDKSKYKQMLMDWIVAICLLFVMQYIMAFSNYIIGKITEVVCSITHNNGYYMLIEDEDGKIEEALTEMNYDVTSLKSDGHIVWHTEDLLGFSRMQSQMAKKINTSYAGYALIYIVLVLFTCYFIFTYLKRVLYMAFLTLIAPLVAMTYPIDKINDGKAQAFNMWMKEYIFNLLIQPMHLLLYTILVSSAFELASKNMVYSLVALAFMIPAEKLLREFFGFQKAHTPGLLAGPAGAALMMSGMNKLFGRPPKGGKDSLKGSSDKSGSDDGKPPRINDKFDKNEALFREDSDYRAASPRQQNQQPTGEQRTVTRRDDNDVQGAQASLGGTTNQSGESEQPGTISNSGEEFQPLALVGSENDFQPPALADSGSDFQPPVLRDSGSDIQSPDLEDSESDFQSPAIVDEGNYDEMDYVNGNSQDNNNFRQEDYDNDFDEDNEDDIIDLAFEELDDGEEIPTSSPLDGIDANSARKRTTRRSKEGQGVFATAGTISRYYARGMANNIKEATKEKIKNAHPVGSAAKFMAKAAGAAALGTAGLAIGITSGDLSKAAQYTTAGAVGGYKMTGRRLDDVERRGNRLTPDGIEQVAERARYETNDDYKEAKQQEYIRKYQKNEKNRFELERRFGRKEANEIMKNHIPTLLDNGVTQMDDIVTIEAMLKDNSIRDIKEGIAIKKYASRIKEDSTKMTAKKRDEWRQTFSKEFGKKDKYSGYNHDNMADSVLDKVDAYNKIKFK